MAKLRPRARIIRTIGDQLISGPEAALIELVKNAYDADSPSVSIKITPPVGNDYSSDEGRIEVRDKGHGMSESEIIDKWFEPATSHKLIRKKSPNGRIMLGSKGVGRFATARLGRKLHIESIYLDNNSKLMKSSLDIDWDIFNQTDYLDEIDISVVSKSASPSEVPGVKLTISSLRDNWTEKQLKLLVRELRRMASPSASKASGFKIFLDLTDFKSSDHKFDGQALVSGAMVEKNSDSLEINAIEFDSIFHYQVKGVFRVDGSFSGTYINQRGDAKVHPVLISRTELNEDESSCGQVDVHLNIYDREGDAVAELFNNLDLGIVGRRDAKAILDENIGIGIYREDFRVRPYGDAETDWLELESGRVQNPSVRLGLNQVWGIVKIESESRSGLIERSSREGLESNGSFTRLQNLLSSLLRNIEARRHDFREKTGMSRKSSDHGIKDAKKYAYLDNVKKAFTALKLDPSINAKLNEAIEKDQQALERAILDIENRQLTLSTLSASGLVLAQVLHDGRAKLSDINTRSKRLVDGSDRLLEQSTFGEYFRSTFAKDAASIHASGRELGQLFKSLDPISGKKRGRPQVFVINEIISRCLDLCKDAIDENAVTVNLLNFDLPVKAVGYESDLMATVINVVENALFWLSSSPTRPRTLNFSISCAGSYVILRLENNGPKIDEDFHDRLFVPGFSLKTEGSGLGLAIAREVMRASGGEIEFDSESKQTTFIIKMKKA